MPTSSPKKRKVQRQAGPGARDHGLPLSLPRGLNCLPRDVVALSQRTRIKQAMAVSVAEKGYVATTVADLTAIAGVSRTTFYEQFTDKEACYLVCFEDQIRFLIKRMRAAIRREDPPPAQFVQALAGFIDTIAAEPVYAMAYMGLAPTVGPKALEALLTHKARVIKVMQSVDATARAHSLLGPRVPAELFGMLTSGMYEFFCAEVRAGRSTRLGRALPQVACLWFGALGYPAWAATAQACGPAELRGLDWGAERPTA